MAFRIRYPRNPELETFLNRFALLWGILALIGAVALLFYRPLWALTHGVGTLFWAVNLAFLVNFSEIIYLEELNGKKLAVKLIGFFLILGLLITVAFVILARFKGAHGGFILSTLLFLGGMVVERLRTLGKD